MKSKIRMSFGTWLLILAAAVNVSRWVGVYTFGQFVALDLVSGLAMGLTMAAALAFTFHRLGKMQPTTPKGKPVMRFWLSLVAGVAILGLSVYLLPPYIVTHMPENFKATLPNPNLWAVLSVLSADLLVVMISAVDSRSAGFTAATGEQSRSTGSSRSGTGSSSGTSRTRRPKQTSRQKKMTAIVPCKWGCGLKGTQAKMNAHSPFCTHNPANVLKAGARKP